MAENNTTASQDLTFEGSTTIIHNFRCVIAIDAANEINTLCKVLRQQITDDIDEAALLARGLSARMDELSKIIMSALGETAEKTDELAYRLRLERAEA